MLKDIIEREKAKAKEDYGIGDYESYNLDELIEQTAQIVAREVLRKVREGVPGEVPSMPDLCIDSHEGWLRSTDTLLTHLQSLEESLLEESGPDAFERQGL